MKSLFDMSDAVPFSGEGSASGSGAGLSGKNADVKAQAIINSGVSFRDLPEENPHKNRAAILALASRGIIGGFGDGTFSPDSTMNLASAVTWQENLNRQLLFSYYATGLPFDLVHAAATALFLWFISQPMLEKLDRIKSKYGLLENTDEAI